VQQCSSSLILCLDDEDPGFGAPFRENSNPFIDEAELVDINDVVSKASC
jgi:hypothetical protein